MMTYFRKNRYLPYNYLEQDGYDFYIENKGFSCLFPMKIEADKL